MKVINMKSARGNKVPNQFIIEVDTDTYFQSYDSVIAKIDINGAITLDSDKWDYSVTTGKYRNAFLREGIEETRRKIASGEYALSNLN